MERNLPKICLAISERQTLTFKSRIGKYGIDKLIWQILYSKRLFKTTASGKRSTSAFAILILFATLEVGRPYLLTLRELFWKAALCAVQAKKNMFLKLASVHIYNIL